MAELVELECRDIIKYPVFKPRLGAILIVFESICICGSKYMLY